MDFVTGRCVRVVGSRAIVHWTDGLHRGGCEMTMSNPRVGEEFDVCLTEFDLEPGVPSKARSVRRKGALSIWDERKGRKFLKNSRGDSK